MPWQPSGCGHNSAETVKVEDMMLLVDSMLENTSTDDEKVEFCTTFVFTYTVHIHYIDWGKTHFIGLLQI